MKSDIETILESQTWKSVIKVKSQNALNSRKPPKKLKPINNQSQGLLLSQKILEDVAPAIVPHPLPRKSILAIPFGSFTSRLVSMIREEETNCVKIPTFPKYPFGIHKDMLANEPRFELLPRDTLINSESVKNIKLESGRINRAISSSLSTSIFKMKKKLIKRHKSPYGES